MNINLNKCSTAPVQVIKQNIDVRSYEQVVKDNNEELWAETSKILGEIPDPRPMTTVSQMTQESWEGEVIWGRLYDELSALGRKNLDGERDTGIFMSISENDLLSIEKVHPTLKEIIEFFSTYPISLHVLKQRADSWVLEFLLFLTEKDVISSPLTKLIKWEEVYPHIWSYDVALKVEAVRHNESDFAMYTW